MEIDKTIIRKLSEAFDAFVGACLTENNEPKKPEYKAIMRARASLPPYCKHGFPNKSDRRKVR